MVPFVAKMLFAPCELKKLCGEPTPQFIPPCTKHDQKPCFAHNDNGSMEVGTVMVYNYY